MIERTGTAEAFETTSGYEGQGSVSITVPADCDCIVACWNGSSCYTVASPGANVFSIGAADFTNAQMYGKLGGSGDNNINRQCALEVLIAPPTGSQTLTFDWGVENLYTHAVVLVSYYKGVDQSSPIYDTTRDTALADCSGMGYTYDTMMVGVVGGWGSNICLATGSIQTQDINKKYTGTNESSAAMGHRLNIGAFDGYSPSTTYDHSAAIVLALSTATPDQVVHCGPLASGYRYAPSPGADEVSGSRNMVVPADADLVLMCMVANWTKGSVEWYRDSSPFFSFGSGGDPFTKAACIMDPDASYGQVIIIEVFPAPTQFGIVNFQWDTTGVQTHYPSEGTVFMWDFFKGVDPDDPIKDWGISEDSSTDITGLDAASVDCMIGVAFDNPSNPSVNFNSQIQLNYYKASGSLDDNWINLCYKYGETDFYWSDGGQGAGCAIILRKLVENAFFYADSAAGIGFSEGMGSLEIELGAKTGIGFTEQTNQDKEKEGSGLEGISFSAVTVGFNSSVWDVAAAVGFTDASGAFNLSAYLRQYGEVLTWSYNAILTGVADGLADEVLTGLKSIQVRMRSGDPSYLNVVAVYTTDLLAAIQARSNGNLVVNMVATPAGGGGSLTETLISAPLDTVRFDRGGESQSITLVGYKTQTYGGGSVPVVLQGVMSESMMATGLMRYRCARPDFYLKPGQLASVGSTEITVAEISYSLAPGNQYMDVSE